MANKMKVRISNYSNAEHPILTIYKAYRLCYSKGEQSEIKIPVNKEGHIDFDAMRDFIVDKMKMGHTTPLEHVSFTFEVSGVSRALTHQLVRHRTGKYNQQSQRYVKLGQFEYVIPPSIAEDPELKARYIEEMERDQEAYDFFVDKLITNQIMKHYPWFTEPTNHVLFKETNRKAYIKFEKKAIEDARYKFPNACTSNITMTFDLHNFRKFYQLRKCSHAQWEIQDLATLCGTLVKDIIPWALIYSMNCGKTCFDCSHKELLKMEG